VTILKKFKVPGSKFQVEKSGLRVKGEEIPTINFEVSNLEL
jgi:hypothetical protein